MRHLQVWFLQARILQVQLWQMQRLVQPAGKKTAIGSAERITPGRPPERQEIANTILSTD